MQTSNGKKAQKPIRDLIFLPVFSLFRRNPGIFALFYKGVNRTLDKRLLPGKEADMKNAFGGEFDDEIRHIVPTLRKQGVFLAKNYFPNDFLGQAREYFENELRDFDINDTGRFDIEVKDEIHSAQTIKTKVLTDRKTKSVFTGFDSYELHGRRRIRHYDYAHLPPIIEQIYSHKKLIALVSTYYQYPVYVKEVVFERLTPGLSHEPWHFDRTRDQFKVMIPLTTVGLDNGPMTYIPGSHQFTNALAESYSGSFTVNGEQPYLVSKRLADLPRDRVVCTGQPGDAIFFDTLGVHTGSRCQVNHRDVIVVCFEVRSPKNRLFTLMGLKN